MNIVIVVIAAFKCHYVGVADQLSDVSPSHFIFPA